MKGVFALVNGWLYSLNYALSASVKISFNVLNIVRLKWKYCVFY